jgi:hypothetical protein
MAIAPPTPMATVTAIAIAMIWRMKTSTFIAESPRIKATKYRKNLTAADIRGDYSMLASVPIAFTASPMKSEMISPTIKMMTPATKCGRYAKIAYVNDVRALI